MAAKSIKPPPDVTGPALDEWNRIVGAIKKLGREVKPADIPLLTLYVQTWVVNQKAFLHVSQFGAVVMLQNKTVCRSPQHQTYVETSKLLRGYLTDLGCTPAAREFDAVPKEDATDPGQLDF